VVLGSSAAAAGGTAWAAAWSCFGKMSAALFWSKRFKCPPILAGHTHHPCVPYIRRWGHVTDENRSHIFVGDVVPPTNIWNGLKSNRTVPIFVGVWPKPMNINYIHRFRVSTNIIWIIFVTTDEYIGTDEWTDISSSVRRIPIPNVWYFLR
jgi:hypothetical protein